MFCKECGNQNDDNAYRCVHCGEHLQQAGANPAAGQDIPNYLAQAIIVTILCCWPLGIPAIVFAAQVNGKLVSGDIDGAMESSRKAKMWCWWAFGGALAAYGLYFLIFVLFAMAGGMH